MAFAWLKNMFSKKPPQRRERLTHGGISARYETAETTMENQPLWSLTDYLSARAANSFQVRRTLKIRSRYECANNSYYRGMTDTLASDLVGKGPRLQVKLSDPDKNKATERRWRDWAKAVGFGPKLRVMAKAKVVDGEGFALRVTNHRVKDEVKLDWNVIESDQVTTPDPGFINLFWVDGVVLDRLGNPEAYHVLRHHPGDLFVPQLNPLIYDTWKPDDICHWFRMDRPGQARGIPEATPALDLFGNLRRYGKAVIAAAEAAADSALMLETPADPDAGNTDLVEPFTQLPYDRAVMTALPAGYKMSCLNPTQPSTTYEMFERITLRQICRCLQIPLNVAMGDSAMMNYSSGRLDHLGYHRQQKVARSECEDLILAKMFSSWYEEARLIPGYLPEGMPEETPPHRWFWDSAESIDPQKDAEADSTELESHTKTLQEIYAEKGKDWEEEIQQRGREVALMEKLKLPVETARKILDPATGKQAKEGEDDAQDRERSQQHAARF